MNAMAVWPTALEAFRALGRRYAPEMDRVAAELGLSGWQGWLLAALAFEPEPVSAARLRVRFPYTAASLYQERLREAATQGFVAPVPQAANEFRLTESGRQAAERVIAAAYAQMATLAPMPPAMLERLAGLLQRLVGSCAAAPEPPGKWCISHSRRTDPGDRAPVVVRIDQYLTDLGAYRDDAHLAAWQPHGVEGHVWEAFTFLWRGEAATLDELCHKLERRGYSRDDYRHGLDDLTRCGWVGEKAGQYQVTPLGGEIRQAAEEATDRYFCAPWSCLTQEETPELGALLVGLRDGL